MRKAGILMPIFSLPSQYGIGDLGREAYNFIDFLEKSRQTLWQVLPIGPTGYGNSPYQNYSAFAGNPLFVDVEALAEAGLLDYDDLVKRPVGRVDYESLTQDREKLLRKACSRFVPDAGYTVFCNENSYWLEPYAAYMSLRAKFGGKPWNEWGELSKFENVDLAELKKTEDFSLTCFVQYMFFSQWARLKKYANDKGIGIVGDIPIYVSGDSADVWQDNRLFRMKDGKPTAVAGCPPDAFSEDGQLWGNPLYDWDYQKSTFFEWWTKRLALSGKLFDIVRIDHFRGVAGYYSIPYGSETAASGKWVTGPSYDFISTVKYALPGLNVIAEDLGYLTKDVRDLLEFSKFPGMKVLQFAFDSREESDYLPHNYNKNCVVYTGTHDNATTLEWTQTADEGDVLLALKYLNVKSRTDIVRAMIRAAYASVADTSVIPIADWLGLGAEARINTPSTVGNNWEWRLDKALLTDELSYEIAYMTELYSRFPENRQQSK